MLRVGVDDVEHVVGHVLEPDLVVASAAALDQVAAHDPDVVAQPSCHELLVERAVERLPLLKRQCDIGRVWLVSNGHPTDVGEAFRLNEVLEDSGETLHVRSGAQARVCEGVVGDIDRGTGLLRELDGPDERGQVRRVVASRVRTLLKVLVVEDADELGLELLHRCFEIREARRGQVRDWGIDVLVELSAVTAEARDEDVRYHELVLGHLDRGSAGVVRRIGLGRSSLTDERG